MINAVIYSRVSSESERQDTERQTNELIDYAHRMGYNINKVYEEKVSGYKKNEERPVFTKMLEDINAIEGCWTGSAPRGYDNWVVLKVNQLLDLMKQHLTLKNALIGWCWEFILLMKLENILMNRNILTRVNRSISPNKRFTISLEMLFTQERSRLKRGKRKRNKL